jgi:hypothetical protein
MPVKAPVIRTTPTEFTPTNSICLKTTLKRNGGRNIHDMVDSRRSIILPHSSTKNTSGLPANSKNRIIGFYLVDIKSLEKLTYCKHKEISH